MAASVDRWSRGVITRGDGSAIINYRHLGRMRAQEINARSPDPVRNAMTFAAAGEFVRLAYGRVRLGARLYVSGKISTDTVIAYIWCLGECDSIEAFYLDDAAVPGGVTVNHYLGTTSQTVNANLASAIGGFADPMIATTPAGHQIGICYTVVRIPVASMATLPRSAQAVIKARKTYDPRTSTTVWSENPALHLADMLSAPELGMGLTVLGVAEAADRADELLEGVSPRLRTSLAFERRLEGMQQAAVMAEYAECFMPWEGSAIRLVPDKPVTAPVRTITEDDIVAGSYSASVVGLEDAITRVEVKYLATSGTATPWKTDTAPAELPGVDDGTIAMRPSGVDLPGITRFEEADRRAKSRLKRAQTGGRHAWRTHDEGVLAQIGDVVELDIPSEGISGRWVRIESAQLSGLGLFDVRARDYSASEYVDDVVTPGGTGTVPVGLILPQRVGTSPPSGWASYTAANTRLIRGAGGAISSGQTGGSNSVTVSGSTSSAPNHTGATPYTTFVGTNGGMLEMIAATPDTTSSGGHSHTYSAGSVTIGAPVAMFPLIIKTGSIGLLAPAAAMMLSASPLAHALLQQITAYNGRLLGAASSQSQSGTATQAASPTYGSAGTHSHHNSQRLDGSRPDFTNGGYEISDAGTGHTHTGVLTITPNAQRRRMLCWGGAEDFPIVVGSIGLWDTSNGAVPTDWQMCDGTNGTPDLRGYFIEFASSNGGSTAGNNTVSWAGSTTPHAHNHRGALNYRAIETQTALHDDGVEHSHSVSGSAAWTPPFYGLVAIQFMGS